MSTALYTILDIESEVESVFKGYLTTTLGLSISDSSDTDKHLTTPRIEVLAVLLGDMEHMLIVPSGTYAGRRMWDFKRVRVEINLVYNPAWPQTPGTLRGTLRKALGDSGAIQTAFSTHAYYQIAQDSIHQTDGARQIDDAEKTETITTVLEAVLQLQPAAVIAAT